jgi:hypothetical protein
MKKNRFWGSLLTIFGVILAATLVEDITVIDAVCLGLSLVLLWVGGGIYWLEVNENVE